MDREAVKSVLRGQEIELPSWAFGNSGTRFKVFGQPGVPRDPYEKIADAAQVHGYTGVAPRVSLHIPWDRVDDYAKLAAYADDLGVRIGAINSNLFQDDEYRLGSLTHPDSVGAAQGDRAPRRVRRRHAADRVDRTEAVAAGRHELSRPGRPARPAGPAGRVAGRDLLAAGPAAPAADRVQVLRAVLLRDGHPGLGHVAAALPGAREQAQVVLDTGHHAPGTNIEFIVMQLLRLAGSARSTSTPAPPTTT